MDRTKSTLEKQLKELDEEIEKNPNIIVRNKSSNQHRDYRELS